jgi:hypothetical protein
MAYHKNTVSLEKMLLKFLGEADPMLSMLEWLYEEMMEVEVNNKLGAGKGEHAPKRTGLSVWNPGKTIRYQNGNDVFISSKDTERWLRTFLCDRKKTF